MTAAPAPRLRRDPRYVAEFAELLRSMGPTSFKREFKRSMLVGYGLVSHQVDRPHGWRRRTLPSDDVSDDVEAVQSLVDRVWPVRKDPGAASGPKVLLGASAECDIVVPDYSISTRHCGFSFEPGRILITDLDSLNGTFVAGQRLASGATCPIQDREPLRVGRIKVQFLARDSFFELVKLHLTGGR